VTSSGLRCACGRRRPRLIWVESFGVAETSEIGELRCQSAWNSFGVSFVVSGTPCFAPGFEGLETLTTTTSPPRGADGIGNEENGRAVDPGAFLAGSLDGASIRSSAPAMSGQVTVRTPFKRSRLR